jgi:hypothetical protein
MRKKVTAETAMMTGMIQSARRTVYSSMGRFQRCLDGPDRGVKVEERSGVHVRSSPEAYDDFVIVISDEN